MYTLQTFVESLKDDLDYLSSMKGQADGIWFEKLSRLYAKVEEAYALSRLYQFDPDSPDFEDDDGV